MKKFTIALLAAAAATTAAVAATIDISPLGFETGFVTAVDQTKGTVTVDGKVYAAKPADLRDVQPGNEIELWIDAQGQAAAVAVKPMDNKNDLLS